MLLALPGAKPGKTPDGNALKKLGAEVAEKASGLRIESICWPDEEAVTATVQYLKSNGAKKISLLEHGQGAEPAGRYASKQKIVNSTH